MNPFRKKSPASPEPRGEEVEEVRVGLSAPVAESLDSAFTDTEIPVDSWAAAPTSSPPLPIKPTPRSPPPPVAPRRRRSQIAPKRYSVPEPPEPRISSDPFNPNPKASPESQAPLPPSPPRHSRTPSISPTNPFFQNQQATSGARRSLDLTDSIPEPGPRPGRQSLDAEAFKRLMLTGQSSAPTVTLESGSTDTSSVSRQSIFEPILETGTAEAEAETPRTSHEIEDDEELQRALAPKANDRGSSRSKPPPPPKPRIRGGGGKSPISPSVSSPRPTSLYSLSQLDKPLPTPPPPPPPPQSPAQAPSSPPSPTPSLHQKRIAPLPPLSRRHSVQSKSNPRLDPGGAEAKTRPPPPPIRRMKSVSARPADYHRSYGLTITTLPPPPPPPPPPPGRRSLSFTVNLPLDESPGVDPASIVYPTGSNNNQGEAAAAVQQDESDILFDLQKLQREVDELRGKYESRGVGVSVSE